MAKMIFAIVFCIVCLVMMFLCFANIHRLIHTRLGSYYYTHTMMSAIGAIMLAIIVGVLITAIAFVL